MLFPMDSAWPLLLLLLCPSLLAAVHYVAPEDCQWTAAGDDVSLACRLRTLNGAFDHTNFSLIQAEHTVSLSLDCDDVLFQSSLGNGSFVHLTALRSLALRRCKLARVPAEAFQGLGQVRNLTLRTHNSEWGQIGLKLHENSLRPLTSLRRLDLSANNAASLPPGLMCRLPELRFVNLSDNAFPDVPSLQLGADACPVSALQHLELVRNRIRVLVDRGFTALGQLRTLSLRRNLISRAEEHSLWGLHHLQVLDLSGNQIVALPPLFFQPASAQLTELYLQNNSISVLPPGLFAKLSHLAVLDTSRNELTSHWLGGDVFADLIRVVVLDLSYNRLGHLDAATFRSQYSLQVLHLHHNELETIADHAFASLYNLHTLTLGHNKLKRLDAHTLSGLYVLTSMGLENNAIEWVHEEAFRNASGSLMELNLSVNKLHALPSAVRALQMLRSLDAGENEITDIHNGSHQGLFQLYSLRLQGNFIGNLSRGAFEDMPSLRILNVARNRIHAIEQGTFDEVPELHALRLDSNSLTDINGLFSNLHDLLMLNISANRISWFDYALIPIGLQWLDIHDNRIEGLGNYFELDSSLKLRTLDASHNRISEIDSSALPNGIEIVFFNDNLIRSISPFTFVGKQNLTRVDLTNNKLASLEMNALRLSEVPARKNLPEFSLSGNPFVCDCNMEWMQRLASLDETRHYPKMGDVEKVECRLTFYRQESVVPLTKARSSQFLCRYRSHCFALCHCCDFDACDCKMVCPENCSCFYDQSWNTNIVDCNGQNHSAVPARIPMDVTELYLDDNDLPALSSHTFIGRKNLQVLHLNRSRVHLIHNRTFNGLKVLEVLQLSHNHLTVLHGYEFERLLKLRELYLSHNRLTSVNNATFSPLRSLEVLHLDHNSISFYQLWNLNVNSRLSEVRVANNPWSCECRFVEEVVDWLQVRGDYISDAASVQCAFNETVALTLVELNLTVCTNMSVGTSFAQRFPVQELVPLLIVLATVVVSLVFLVALVLAYRRQVSLWLFSRYGLRLNGAERGADDEEKLFDAFVSYSKKDEAFVTQILAPELECGDPPYRLCLHYRDLPPVAGYLSAEAIAEAMDSSRRTVVVLSENFLQSEWCRYEFKAAHQEVLRTRKHHHLVVVVLGRIATRDAEVRLWLKRRPFLRWGERHFWPKLRYALPDNGHGSGKRHQDAAVHM